ncbi:MAG: hypothetical protein GXZ06_07275 [Tissierellia bacterium]|nr:hypothetical protein [Tissierellia bacterium]
MARVYLKDIAHGRSGDKGDTCNICVFARDPKDYDFLREYLTAERVKEHFGDMVKGEVIRYEVPTLKGFNFVMKHALDGGATISLRQDNLGKSMASALMRMVIDDYENEKKGDKNENQ